MAVISPEYANTFLGMLDTIRGNVPESVFNDIQKYGINATDNPAQILRNSGYDVTTAGNGAVLSYTYKGTGTVSNEIWANSNLQTGTASAANAVNFNAIGDVSSTVTETGEKVVSGASKVTKFTDGVKGVLNTPVAGKVGPAVMAAATGIQLAHVIDGSIYHIGKAMGADPPEALNPDSWSSITADMSDSGWEGVNKWAFNTIFDIDTNKNSATMYADANAVAYMAWYLQHAGWFSSGGYSSATVNISDFGKSVLFFDNLSDAIAFSNVSDWSDRALNELNQYKYIVPRLNSAGWNTYYLCGTNTNPLTYDYGDITDNGGGLYAARALPTGNSWIGDYNYGQFYGSQYQNSALNGNLGNYILGKIGNGAPDGVEQGKTADGQTAANHDSKLAGADSQEKMLDLLKELYPELWDNRIENSVLQDDGSNKTYTYIPIPIPAGGEGDNPSGGVVPDAGTIPSYGPDSQTATDGQIASIIKWITQQVTPTGDVNPDPTGTGQPDYDPTGMVNPKTGIDPDTGKPTTGGTPNPPDTGGGDTPVVILPEGHANALYAIYNPTQSQLNSLGAWLWSSDFVDQLLKLFSDPMQAIIGLHKIYATPATGAEQNIKVGFLDSGVSSKIVTDQYTTVDCGSVNLFEYFGNVFDYAPYTQLRLYLPFIGIVNLDTEDAMRGVIHVVYHVDVLSGACLAEVKITRDAAGGTLYQYAGNAAVTMPISSGSYIGVIANVVGVASSAIGGFASGGVAGGIAGGVTGALTRRGGTQVQHSGNFSGNAGAMGIKKPYLIIERPQTALADNYAEYIGNPSNTTVTLSSCTGYIKMKEVHLENVPATGAELSEIEQTLKQGVII